MNQIPVPTVLECIRFVASNPHKHQRIARNYEFDLYLDGKHKIRIDGISYDDTDQCLIFRKPGQFTEGIGDYNMYALTLDFSDSMFHPQKLYRNTWGNIQPLCDFKELNELPSVFRPAHFEELKNLLDKLSLASAGESNDHLQQQYAKEFLLLALYDACNFMRTQDAQKADGNPYVKKAREYITKNFYRDITVKQIAQELHLNQNHFIKLFKKEFKSRSSRFT